MAITLSRPSGRRSDDVRSLRFRHRTITFSGNYAQGGELLDVRAGSATKTPNLGMSRILAIVPLDGLIRAPAGVTGLIPVIDVASDGKTATIRALEDAAGAAGATVGVEKNNAEAYVASSKLDVLIIGE